MEERPSAGWSFYAWLVYLTVGVMNLMLGAMMLVRKEYFPTGGLIYESIAQHGWVLIVIALVQIVLALALAAKQQWARYFGITVAVVGIVVWFYYMLYLPILGLVAIAMYLLVIYALASRWDGAVS